MSEPGRSDHWDLLASELGAEPDPGEVEEGPAATIELPEATVPPPPPQAAGSEATPEERPSKVRRPAANWDAVATALGLTPEPEPEEAPPLESPLERKREDTGWQVPPEEAEAVDAAPEPAAAGEWPRFMFEEPEGPQRERPGRRVDEPSETVEKAVWTAKETAGIEEGLAAPTEERKPSRRRRRRRRKTREPGRVAGEQRESEKAEQVSPSAAEEPEEGQPTGEEGQPDKARSRRRRKRPPLREKGRTSIPDEVAADQSERGPKRPVKTAARVEKPAETDMASDETAEGETDEDEAEQGTRLSKAAHRAIPTWEEAVGLIISTNLESRAKNPSTGFSRGRGKGRGPSKPQGSRRRPPEKRRN